MLRIKVYVNQFWHLFSFVSFWTLSGLWWPHWDLQMFRFWKLGGRSPAPDGSGHFGKLNEKLLCGDEKTVCQLSEEEEHRLRVPASTRLQKSEPSHFPWHLLSISPGRWKPLTSVFNASPLSWSSFTRVPDTVEYINEELYIGNRFNEGLINLGLQKWMCCGFKERFSGCRVQMNLYCNINTVKPKLMG